MPRVAVDIKFDPASGTMAAHDKVSGKRIPTYSRLCYGATPAAQAGISDDPAEAIKSFTDSTPTASGVKNPAPHPTAVLAGFADVP